MAGGPHVAVFEMQRSPHALFCPLQILQHFWSATAVSYRWCCDRYLASTPTTDVRSSPCGTFSMPPVVLDAHVLQTLVGHGPSITLPQRQERELSASGHHLGRGLTTTRLFVAWGTDDCAAAVATAANARRSRIATQLA